MDDQDKSREQLLDEARALRARVAGLEALESERRRAEQELRRSEDRFAKVFHASPVAIAISTLAEGRFIDVNDAFLRMMGHAREDLVGRTSTEAHLWVDPAQRGPLLQQLLARGSVRDLDTVFRTRSGQTRHTLLSLEVIQLRGEPHLLGLLHDITDRKQMEQSLRDSEERLRGFFDAAVEGLVIHEMGPILDANPALAAMFGYPLPELIGLNGLELIAPESQEVVREHVLAGDERPYEATGRRKDGSTFPLEVCGKNIDFRGRQVRVTAMRDITRRKQAEEKLQEYARRLLEVQEAERRHFARELHDEVGQVLTGLRLSLETARGLPPEQFPAALGQAQRLVADLTGKVRDLSLRMRPSMLDDLGLLPALLWHLERFTAQTRVRVEFEHHGLEGRLGPEVETAAYRIVQEALTNVARHAGVRACAVRLWRQRDALRLEVEDRGRGFDPEAPAGRGPSSGLSGMRERATLLGGWLRLTSRPGAGTRLSAGLPAGGGRGR